MNFLLKLLELLLFTLLLLLLNDGLLGTMVGRDTLRGWLGAESSCGVGLHGSSQSLLGGAYVGARTHSLIG